MAVTYILKSSITKRFYIGSSHFDDTKKRLKSHNKGDVKSTKSGRPWSVVHFEMFQNYTDARKRENFLKSGVGRKWIYENLKNKD